MPEQKFFPYPSFMKKNYEAILFDLGNVLIRWDPSALIAELEALAPEPDRPFLRQQIHNWGVLWDRGRLDEGIERTISQQPEYAAFLRAFCAHWSETLGFPIDGSVALLRSLKAQGYKVYAASNWAADTYEQSRERMPFLDLFDGLQISGQVGLTKPDPAFFRKMMQDFGISPDKALFIDDHRDNIEAAKSLGFTTILFESPEQLATMLQKTIAPEPPSLS